MSFFFLWTKKAFFGHLRVQVFGTFFGEMRGHLFKLLFNTFPIFFWRNASNCWKLLKSSTNNYLRRISPEFFLIFQIFSGEMRGLVKLLKTWKLLKSSTNNHLRRISPEFFLIFQFFSGEMRGLVKLLKTSKYILSSTHFAGISDFFSTSLKNLASTHFSKKQAKTCTRFSSKICYH